MRPVPAVPASRQERHLEGEGVPDRWILEGDVHHIVGTAALAAWAQRGPVKRRASALVRGPSQAAALVVDVELHEEDVLPYADRPGPHQERHRDQAGTAVVPVPEAAKCEDRDHVVQHEIQAAAPCNPH